jgi:hypothetical protein
MSKPVPNPAAPRIDPSPNPLVFLAAGADAVGGGGGVEVEGGFGGGGGGVAPGLENPGRIFLIFGMSLFAAPLTPSRSA